jgi:hypothetical protein
MKKILLSLLLLFVFIVNSYAAGCTFANTGSATDPGAADNTTNFSTTPLTNAVNAGDLIVVGLANFNTDPAAISGITDSAGNTYTRQVDYYTTSSHGLAIYTSKITTGAAAGTLTLTVNKNGVGTTVVIAYHHIAAANWDGTTIFDGTPPAAGDQTGTTNTITTAATSVATDCVIQYFDSSAQSVVTAGTPQTGFTASVSNNNETGFTQIASASQQMAATSSGVTAGWPSITNSTSKHTVVEAVVIKGAAGGGGGGGTYVPGIWLIN